MSWRRGSGVSDGSAGLSWARQTKCTIRIKQIGQKKETKGGGEERGERARVEGEVIQTCIAKCLRVKIM